MAKVWTKNLVNLQIQDKMCCLIFIGVVSCWVIMRYFGKIGLFQKTFVYLNAKIRGIFIIAKCLIKKMICTLGYLF